jgi:hypothetical protein
MELWVPFCCAIVLMAQEILELTFFVDLMPAADLDADQAYDGGEAVLETVAHFTRQQRLVLQSSMSLASAC